MRTGSGQNPAQDNETQSFNMTVKGTGILSSFNHPRDVLNLWISVEHKTDILKNAGDI